MPDNYGDDYGDDTSGDESNLLGAIARRMGGARSRYRPKPQLPTPQLRQQGTWNEARLRSFMGIGTATWAPTVATDFPLEVEPQESFEGRRLIVDVIASGGTSLGIVLVRRIDVGTMPQSPSVAQAAPAAMFRADATYSYLDLQIAYRATKLTTTLGISAMPGTGVTVVAACGMFGNWIR